MTEDTPISDDFDNEGGGGGLPAQLRDPMGMWRRQMRWILATLLICLCAAGAVTVLFPLEYKARATILLSAKSIPDEFVPTTIIANIIEEFEAIRGEVFSREGLTHIISSTGLYKEDHGKVPMGALAERLSKDLLVAPLTPRLTRDIPTAMTFEVTLAGEDPERLAKVVNFTVAELINANIAFRSRQARVTTRFMEQEFTRADEALREHQRKLAQFRAKNRGALPEEQEASLANLERLEEQRRSAILRISDFRSQLERIDATSRLPGTDDSVEALRIRLQQAQSIYTSDHPTVRSLERQLAAIEESVGSGISPIDNKRVEERLAIERGVNLEQQRLDQIDSASNDLERNLSLSPEISEEYSALVREEQILQENYVEYLRKLKDAELALSLESSQQGSQLVSLDPAIPPTAPVIPRWMIAGAGVVLSLGLASLIGIAREFIYPVVIDEEHLESATPIPCVGSITEIA